MLHAIFRMRMGDYIGIPTSCVSVFKLRRVSVLFPAATDEVSCYDVIVKLHSLPWFAEAINQGMYHNDTRLTMMVQGKQNVHVLFNILINIFGTF